MRIADAESCPCGAAAAYANHCKPLHEQGYAGLGTTAEQTMRSRYSAYVLHDEDYLRNTWHSSTRPESLDFSPDIEWHGLTIVSTDRGNGLDADGLVEFRARFQRADAPLELHELSSFVRENGRWYYVEGTDPDLS